ncbi:tetratricopeptide repeat protein [Pseudonocardia humida]|uniref:Tetratricopeptide repeat protein n=1 Tax=Pseudonocardia humida TaxID=2800819 RepID=A0ABT0ZT79_9PSEU|nr:tetratricopeptide repeat protein [Pseudonocardia humida]MCO1653931.1 tetratricopeptide repeat protein [Pseudonocardia humida]
MAAAAPPTETRPDPLDDDVRAAGDTVPRRSRLRLVVPAVAVAGLLATVLAAGLQATAGSDPARAPTAVSDRLSDTIAQSQARLRRVPGDAATWAGLGGAYVEQARVTADPVYYAQAQGALDRSLQLQPDGNAPALIGLGALANARHDFAAARGHAEQALALNPAGAEAHGVLADAATQLGDTATATAAVQRMLDLRPGVAAFTRASYELELRGDVEGARTALERALGAATSTDETAFCEYHLGELAWSGGRVDEASRHYERGLLADPDHAALRQGRAKVLAATGRLDAAIEAYRVLALRVPLPRYLLEYGELLESAGRADEARAQYRLLDAQRELAEAAGSRDGLAAAQLAADHGDPTEAVALAEAEYAAAPSAFAADALGWALHRAGRDAEALPHTERATALGRRDATTDFHHGMVLAGLGRTGEAIAVLDGALATNPHFSPLHAPTARRTLDALRGQR